MWSGAALRAGRTDATIATSLYFGLDKDDKKLMKKLRRKARDSKVRLEMSRKLAALEGKPPTEHFFSHCEADPRCEFCATAKQRKAAARAQRLADQIAGMPSTKCPPDALGLVHFDLIRVRTADLRGCRWWLTSRCARSKYPRGTSLPDKEPATVWKATQALHPGTRLAHNITPSAETSVVAKMNFAWGGGSSRVFNKALKACFESICTSSMM